MLDLLPYTLYHRIVNSVYQELAIKGDCKLFVSMLKGEGEVSSYIFSV